MNFDKAKQLFLQLLGDSDFIFHPKFLDELAELLKTTLKGHENEFFKKLTKVMKQLDVCGRSITDIDGHEKLHAPTGEWYSLHITTPFINLRMLIAFIDCTPVFLVCFDEKSGKKATSYQNYLPVLNSRLHEMEENL